MRFLFPLSLLITSCVAYRPAPVDLESTAAAIDVRTPGPLDYEGAYAYALETHHEILRLKALARAAGEDLTPASVSGDVETRDEMLSASADPLALARIGPRGAEARVRACERDALLAELRIEEQTLAADLAETYLVETTLAEWPATTIALKSDAFARAGLASASSLAMLEAAHATATAEKREIEALRRANEARARHLLGIGPKAPFAFLRDDKELPPLPEQSQSTLYRRPDLALALAQYRVADAIFRMRVIEQYPTFELGPAIGFDLRGFGGVGSIRLPVRAAGPARAAEARREAERASVEGALLVAREEAIAAAEAFEATRLRAEASALSRDAMASAFGAVLARLEVEPDALSPVAEMAGRVVAESVMARVAALDLVRARIALARAYAWPFDRENAE